jgi:NYN domain
VSRTVVYVDALNLYYRALRFTSHKWLNLEALSQAVLPAHCQVVRINYYYAPVSGRTDAGAPGRQNVYLRALKTTPLVHPFKGNFIAKKAWAGLVSPREFRPAHWWALVYPRPVVVRVWKTEEKGSDVNLGAHLVRDAFQGKFDTAAVLTNDTDLVEPVRIVVEECRLPVILMTPTNQPATSLLRYASNVRHIGPYLGPSQFPNPIMDAKGRAITKPPSW